MSDGKQQLAKLVELREALKGLGDLTYQFQKYLESHELLLSKYAKFHVGDRVRLIRAPTITSETAPGWMGSKHFLVPGALGEIREADVHNGNVAYRIVFDNESWIDNDGKTKLVTPERRHMYHFAEKYLEAEGLMAIECKHGQLARQCEICALEADVRRLRDALHLLIDIFNNNGVDDDATAFAMMSVARSALRLTGGTDV
jgi:hypothetical protein